MGKIKKILINLFFIILILTIKYPNLLPSQIEVPIKEKSAFSTFTQKAQEKLVQTKEWAKRHKEALITGATLSAIFYIANKKQRAKDFRIYARLLKDSLSDQRKKITEAQKVADDKNQATFDQIQGELRNSQELVDVLYEHSQQLEKANTLLKQKNQGMQNLAQSTYEVLQKRGLANEVLEAVKIKEELFNRPERQKGI